MPRDDRLYAKFDIGMDEHPKIMGLSDAAFRALIESTMYSRRQNSDGFLADVVVGRKWSAEVAAELGSNDVERPSWARVDGGWQIHDYEKHQITKADIEAKRAAGRKGGLAKAQNRSSEDVAPASDSLQHIASTSLAKREGERQLERQNPPSNEGGGATTPFCSAHPSGTDRPCRACQAARVAFEEQHKPKPRATVSGIITDPDCDIHPGRPRIGCDRCAEERATS